MGSFCGNGICIVLVICITGFIFTVVGSVMKRNKSDKNNVLDNPNNIKKCLSALDDESNSPNLADGEYFVIAGYSLIFLGLIISFFFIDGINRFTVIERILTLILLGGKLALNVIYFDNIKKDKVANEYYSYENLSKNLLILQIVLLAFDIKNSRNEGSSPNLFAFIVAIFLLNIIFTLISYIILKFYSTDG